MAYNERDPGWGSQYTQPLREERGPMQAGKTTRCPDHAQQISSHIWSPIKQPSFVN